MENKVEDKEGQRKRGEVQHTKHKAHSRGSLQGNLQAVLVTFSIA